MYDTLISVYYYVVKTKFIFSIRCGSPADAPSCAKLTIAFHVETNLFVCFFIVISTASQIINLNLLYHTLGLHKKNNTLGYVCFGFAAAVVVVVIFVVLRYFIAESLLNRARKK